MGNKTDQPPCVIFPSENAKLLNYDITACRLQNLVQVT